MANVLTDLVTYAASLFPTETIRGGFVPDTPDKVVVIMSPDPGLTPLETMGATQGAGPKLERHILQIRCRGVQDDFQDARNLAETVYRGLNNRLGITLSGTVYVAIEALHPPYTLSADENGRWHLGFNILVTKYSNV